jgi:hypothetical protein
MPLYYFLYLIILLVAFFLLVRYIIQRRTSLPIKLFIKGLRTENSGKFDEATISYENALNEVKKSMFHHSLKNKIIEKLKVLRTIKKYKKDQNFIRENNSWLS